MDETLMMEFVNRDRAGFTTLKRVAETPFNIVLEAKVGG